MNRFKKVFSVVFASLVSTSLLVSTVSLSASQSERDPNGDGKLYFNDVI